MGKEIRFMPFISTRTHQQFIRQFQLFLSSHTTNNSFANADENIQLLKADIDKLQKIAEVYTDTYSQLQDLAIQYKIMLKRTRVNMRRQQIKRNDAGVLRLK